ncbi:CmpA/NrtA family ABC transporter substrate-binding protein [Sandaracinus amylolyticus]|uniref:Nitrate ABC transporter, nitrate-binding protein n=1 Tax=Sandaracinus amylolyticus TaxID=927083 RepID=A0A0F6SDR3_9BACT|nr:CmpA/NrtA family ABC transporter substrate-binding protein [Sandaracinus amylolyticus]AKF03894.1 Nitrate ABC transporter, nitrate-binding protein [Sandaracinus amylolyticus]
MSDSRSGGADEAQRRRSRRASRKLADRALRRREFLKVAATAASTLAIGGSALGCSDGDPAAQPPPTAPAAAPAAGGASAPEVSAIRFGIIALTDCSPIVIAHERGIFRRYGIESSVVKGASWAAIRDSLTNGDIQATHMLLGMPLASTMGIGGSPRVPMVVPWLLNRNGQAITLANTFRGSVRGDAAALKPLVDEARAAGNPMTFAMTFPPGTHAMWMRYFLASGGIHPDRDVALVTVPPAQMVANMRIGRMHGFCVGEPWNARSIADGIGYTAITTQEMWRDHPEKVLAFREDFAEQNPRTVKAILKAIHEASVWLDDLANRPEQARIVSQTTYINCAPELILGRLQGHYDYGDGRTLEDPSYMIFSQRGCNAPQAKYASWFLSQFRRWGLVQGRPDYDGVARRVMRMDLYAEAMRELGVAVPEPDVRPETFFDGNVFDPADPEGYATSFPVHALAG